MKIWIKRIPEEGSRFEGEEPGSILELDGERFIRGAGDVRYSLYAQHVSGELVVSGALSVDLELACIRCADFFSTTVVDSDFLRAYPASEDVDSVDITEDMREDLVLHVPGFPVCSEGCKGLCAQCGADLNKGSCACETGVRPNPWSALDILDL
jgi:uncharacterized protein